MPTPFERLTPGTQGFNVDDFNRLCAKVEQLEAGFGSSQPSFTSAAGVGLLPRPDTFRFLMIQVSAVTESAVLGNGTTVMAGYDWQEVVRRNGLWVVPGDGRSSTALLSGVVNFPAFDIRASANVPLNANEPTSAYVAWIDDDERSLTFIGLPSLIVSDVSCVNGQIVMTQV